MISNFSELFWHDAILKSIYVDRRNPGDKDTITLSIIWPNDERSSSIEFYDCYALKANMNFGIDAFETILSAECLTNSEQLNSIRKEWSGVGINLENLKCYKITTNSTGGIISIYCLGFR